jgi:hypothetical protein
VEASGFDVYEAALGSAGDKLHFSGDLGKQGVVFAHAHIEAGVETTSSLSDKNGSAGYGLAVEALDSQSLGVAVATVSGTTYSFFMCHF